MKRAYSLYECSDRATRMIHHSRFPILALPTGAQSEYETSFTPEKCSFTQVTFKYLAAKNIKVLPHLPIVWSWPLVIFDCSPNWRNSWEIGHFSQIRISSWPVTRYSTKFLKRFRSGLNVGSGALKSLVAILKNKFSREQYMYIGTARVPSTCFRNFFLFTE